MAPHVWFVAWIASYKHEKLVRLGLGQRKKVRLPATLTVQESSNISCSFEAKKSPAKNSSASMPSPLVPGLQPK
jgi:hypothetical protein